MGNYYQHKWSDNLIQDRVAREDYKIGWKNNKENQMSDQFKHKEGNGSLWNNENKENDNQPDMKGKVTLPDGEEKALAGWWNESQKGDKYISVQISDVYVKEEETISPNDPGDEDDKASNTKNKVKENNTERKGYKVMDVHDFVKDDTLPF